MDGYRVTGSGMWCILNMWKVTRVEPTLAHVIHMVLQMWIRWQMASSALWSGDHVPIGRKSPSSTAFYVCSMPDG